MKFHVIIPARLESQRLPEKVLLDIAGKPMLQHVVAATAQSGAASVTVATDNPRIKSVVESFGGRAVMTASSHQSGTDRLAEAAQILALDADDIVVNVQGDEPLMPPELVVQVARNLHEDDACGIATMCESIGSVADYQNPNAVKVVFNTRQHALYFSRASIPFLGSGNDQRKDGLQVEAWRHIGLYAYRVRTLQEFVALPVHALERSERLEQLRALANGIAIHVGIANTEIPAGVDTEADLRAVREHFAAL